MHKPSSENPADKPGRDMRCPYHSRPDPFNTINSLLYDIHTNEAFEL